MHHKCISMIPSPLMWAWTTTSHSIPISIPLWNLTASPPTQTLEAADPLRSIWRMTKVVIAAVMFIIPHLPYMASLSLTPHATPLSYPSPSFWIMSFISLLSLMLLDWQHGYSWLGWPLQGQRSNGRCFILSYGTMVVVTDIWQKQEQKYKKIGYLVSNLQCNIVYLFHEVRVLLMYTSCNRPINEIYF